MTQRQEFQVLRTYKYFEIREYQPCVIAEVNVASGYSEATNAAFGSLLKYISKGNKTSERIAMTAPVVAAHRSEVLESDEWFISFIMPSGSAIGHLPNPDDPQVVLRELDGETCVVSSFRGRATAALTAKKIQELRIAAKDENLALSRETRICRFDPPFKPGFVQYNEIVIPVYMWAE